MENFQTANNELKQDFLKSEFVSKVKVIPRNSLNGITEMTVEGQRTYLGEVKHFKDHPYLAQALPQNLSIAWTQMPAGGELPAHFHPCSSMVIVAKGQGQLTGDVNSDLNEGDIAYVPAGSVHGFIGDGEEGFWALSIQFEASSLYDNPNKPQVSFVTTPTQKPLDELINQNEEFSRKFLLNPIFSTEVSHAIKDQQKRRVLLDCLQVMSNSFQRLMFSRMALCDNVTYRKVFFEHFLEELGLELLEHEDPRKIAELNKLLSQSWDMLNLFLSRTAQLVLKDE